MRISFFSFCLMITFLHLPPCPRFFFLFLWHRLLLLVFHLSLLVVGLFSRLWRPRLLRRGFILGCCFFGTRLFKAVFLHGLCSETDFFFNAFAGLPFLRGEGGLIRWNHWAFLWMSAVPLPQRWFSRTPGGAGTSSCPVCAGRARARLLGGCAFPSAPAGKVRRLRVLAESPRMGHGVASFISTTKSRSEKAR